MTRGVQKLDAVLAGVGGQGVLSIGSLLAGAADEQGLWVRQSEVHGMSQRGGAVEAYLRISRRPIRSDLVARGGADLVLSLEPLEALRHLDFLSPDGAVVSATEPVANLPDYPDVEGILDRLRTLPRVVLLDAATLAREAGTVLAANVVLAGAASPLLPVPASALEERIRRTFEAKGDRIVAANLRAFRAGRERSAHLAELATSPASAG